MSFSFDFHAADVEAARKEVPPNTPFCVFAFIELAMRALEPGQIAHVKAAGHLYGGQDYRVSNVTIEVHPITVRKTDPEREARNADPRPARLLVDIPPELPNVVTGRAGLPERTLGQIGGTTTQPPDAS